MKRVFVIPILLAVSACMLFAGTANIGDGYSLKSIKKALKKDSSPASNARLAKEVLENGVSFLYTQKREAELRQAGADDNLITAIWQSIIDKTEEANLYAKFEETYSSSEKEIRRGALETGNRYIERFGVNPRFSSNTETVRKELRYLACEFDPSLGC